MKSGPPAARSTPKATATGSGSAQATARAGAAPAERSTAALGVAVAALEAAAGSCCVQERENRDRDRKACVARALLAAREAVECALRQQAGGKPNAKARTGGGASSEPPLAVQLARLALALAAQAAPARESFKPAGALGASRQNPFVGVCLTSAPRIERNASGCCSCGPERAPPPQVIGKQLLTLALQVVCDELADSGFLDASDRSTQSTVQQSPKAHSAPARARPQPALRTRSGAGATLRGGRTSSPLSDYSEHSVADAGTQTWARVPSNLAHLLARHAISEALTALLERTASSTTPSAPSAAPQHTPLPPPLAPPPDALQAASRCSSRSFVPTESSVSIPFALDSYASSCCVDEAPPESLPLDACQTALRALEHALDELDAELAAPSGEQLVQLRALSQPPFPIAFAERAHSSHAVSARASNVRHVPTPKCKSKPSRMPTANANPTRAPNADALSDAESLQSCSMRVSSLAAGAIAYAVRELRSLMSVNERVSQRASTCENEHTVRVAHSEPVTRVTRSASSSLYSRVSVRESLTQVSRNPSGRRPLCIRGTRARVPVQCTRASASSLHPLRAQPH